ncbi:MAG: hypothetical protein LBE89_02665 [Helicobacteraceae bacterium]|jgi:hypothetical protein|nr:hypothetical protein [Helicobacteraceae bacterium]
MAHDWENADDFDGGQLYAEEGDIPLEDDIDDILPDNDLLEDDSLGDGGRQIGDRGGYDDGDYEYGEEEEEDYYE